MQIDRCVELYAEGRSSARLGERFGVTDSTVHGRVASVMLVECNDVGRERWWNAQIADNKTEQSRLKKSRQSLFRCPRFISSAITVSRSAPRRTTPSVHRPLRPHARSLCTDVKNPNESQTRIIVVLQHRRADQSNQVRSDWTGDATQKRPPLQGSFLVEHSSSGGPRQMVVEPVLTPKTGAPGVPKT